MYTCPICKCAVDAPGPCPICLYKATDTGDTYLGRKICETCKGTGRILGHYGYEESCPYCQGNGYVDTF